MQAACQVISLLSLRPVPVEFFVVRSGQDVCDSGVLGLEAGFYGVAPGGDVGEESGAGLVERGKEEGAEGLETGLQVGVLLRAQIPNSTLQGSLAYSPRLSQSQITLLFLC